MRNGDRSDSLLHLEVFALETITRDGVVVSISWFLFYDDLIEDLWFSFPLEIFLDDLRDHHCVILILIILKVLIKDLSVLWI